MALVDSLLSAIVRPDGDALLMSITAPSTADAVQRFVELAAPEMRKAVQNTMAESLRGAVAPVLLRRPAAA